MSNHRYISSDDGEALTCIYCGQCWDDDTEDAANYPCGSDQGRHHWTAFPPADNDTMRAECTRCDQVVGELTWPGEITECRS